MSDRHRKSQKPELDMRGRPRLHWKAPAQALDPLRDEDGEPLFDEDGGELMPEEDEPRSP